MTSARCPAPRELLAHLTEAGCPWAIATSGPLETAGPVLERLGVPEAVPIVTRDQVAHAKPDPDLFLAAVDRLGVVDRATRSWSATASGTCWPPAAPARSGIGLLSGGYGTEELERAGAYRVYEDPAMLMLHLDELGVRRE